MKQRFICLKDCQYTYYHDSGFMKLYNFRKGRTYVINISYILSDKNTAHEVYMEYEGAIKYYGMCSTISIFRNFIHYKDYELINSAFDFISDMDFVIDPMDAKRMRDNIFKDSCFKK